MSARGPEFDALAGPVPAECTKRPASSEKYPSILAGEGKDDYARYMKTDTLLALQRQPGDMLHRDELLFQIVHQSTELWLKLACFEADQAARDIVEGRIGEARLLIGRSAFALELLTRQLEMLSRITPADFQRVRPALGNGSGFESPGWQAIRRSAAGLQSALNAVLARHEEDLLAIYRGDPVAPIYQLCEALLEWDERIALWRSRHYKVAVRTLGHGTVGTKGLPTDQLAALLNHKCFPDLWAVRTRLTTGAADRPCD
jgi:tryptophan 2,3-dioxygenase